MTLRSRLRRPAVWAFVGALALGFTSACSEPAPPPAPAAPAVKTAQERATWYQECWNRFNDKAWDKFQDCYDANAVSESIDSTPPSVMGRAAIIEAGKNGAVAFPDRRGEVRVILGNGDKFASVALWTATNTGPMPGPDGKPMPATGKPVGFLMAHTIDFDPTGSVAVRDAAYIDEGTLMAQLGINKNPARAVEKATGAPAMVVLAKNDDTEKANLTAARAIFDAVNSHDIKAIEALTPDDYHSMTVAEAKDMNKKESLESTKQLFAGFPDVKITPVTMWSAGDYVVVTGTFEGTNTGDTPMMKKTGAKVSSHFLEILKFVNGKVQDDWLFYNGGAMMAQMMKK